VCLADQEAALKPDDMVCDVLAKWEKVQLPPHLRDAVFQFMWKKHVFLRTQDMVYVLILSFSSRIRSFRVPHFCPLFCCLMTAHRIPPPFPRLRKCVHLAAQQASLPPPLTSSCRTW
jgi:hypothetical protein